ncbi:AraC family transcriptional regulator [Saccharibacillus sp. JS10]|uniref:helix-turn-helix transcriptional regulator n=1 Tax=Saccharibacillus sp. JS10 TaxID=2950552 RepID=UPI00210C9331|nr:AraC family transcriptional regulator [Saccharibacillus sp. JS10]MCQ4085470.1 AraC family transcriptional regulator [Saccharibacillus sp. JS10]
MSTVNNLHPKYRICKDRFSIQHMKRKGVTAMPRPHRHEQIELYYLCEGERVYFVDDRVITLRKGELILIPAAQIHSTASSEVAEFERILINYDPRLLPTSLQNEAIWFHQHRYRVFTLTLREQDEAKRLLLKMVDECRSERCHYEDCVLALFTELSVLLQRSENMQLDEPSEAAKPPLHDLINEVAAYIRKHYDQSLTLEQTAAHFFISASYLSRVFHRLTGFHFREYIIHIRMREAEKQLIHSEERIQDIALSIGFEHLSHFNKTFKKATGWTPLQYRKQTRSDRHSK